MGARPADVWGGWGRSLQSHLSPDSLLQRPTLVRSRHRGSRLAKFGRPAPRRLTTFRDAISSGPAS